MAADNKAAASSVLPGYQGLADSICSMIRESREANEALLKEVVQFMDALPEGQLTPEIEQLKTLLRGKIRAVLPEEVRPANQSQEHDDAMERSLQLLQRLLSSERGGPRPVTQMPVSAVLQHEIDAGHVTVQPVSLSALGSGPAWHKTYGALRLTEAGKAFLLAHHQGRQEEIPNA